MIYQIYEQYSHNVVRTKGKSQSNKQPRDGGDKKVCNVFLFEYYVVTMCSYFLYIYCIYNYYQVVSHSCQDERSPSCFLFVSSICLAISARSCADSNLLSASFLRATSSTCVRILQTRKWMPSLYMYIGQHTHLYS